MLQRIKCFLGKHQPVLPPVSILALPPGFTKGDKTHQGTTRCGACRTVLYVPMKALVNGGVPLGYTCLSNWTTRRVW